MKKSNKRKKEDPIPEHKFDEVVSPAVAPLPPSPKYSIKTVKCSLEKLITDPKLLHRLRIDALRVARIHRETLHFINIFIRVQSEEAMNRNDPFVQNEQPWTKERVKEFICVITTCKGERKQIDPELLKIREKHYDKLRPANLPLESRTGLAGANVLNELAEKIQAEINTNIKEHFFERQLFFLSVVNKISKPKAKALQESINEEAKKKNPQFNVTGLSYKIEQSVAYTLEVYPERFLFAMHQINCFYDEENVRRKEEEANTQKKAVFLYKFAVIPLSTGFVPGAHLGVDTASLCALVGGEHEKVKQYRADRSKFNEKRKEEGGDEVKKKAKNMDTATLDHNDEFWANFVNMKHILGANPDKDRCRSGHHFITDGVYAAVIILYRIQESSSDDNITGVDDSNNNDQENNNQTNKKRKTESNTNNSKTNIGQGRKAAKRARQKAAKQAENLKKIQSLGNQVDPSKVVGLDPGMVELAHLTTGGRDDRGKRVRYTRAQRQFESKAKAREQQNKKPDWVQQLENVLSQHDSRSSTLEKFKEYLKARFAIQKQLYNHYEKKVYRLNRWYNFRDRRSSEDRFIQLIITTYGKDVIIGYGDWSGSTRGIKGGPAITSSLKRRIAQKLMVIDVPEYNTSKTCSRCLGEVIPDKTRTITYRYKNGDTKVWPVRGIRTCIGKSECGGFLRWNRDENAAINIRANLLHALAHNGQWHPKFTRSASSSVGQANMEVNSYGTHTLDSCDEWPCVTPDRYILTKEAEQQ